MKRLLPKRDEADLRWALCWADGELGLHSNYAAMASCLELGLDHVGGLARCDIPDGVVEKATRERAVRWRLERVGRFHRVVLTAAYGPVVWKMRLWGDVATVTPFTPLAQEHNGAVLPWLLKTHWSALQGDLADRYLVQRIREQAEKVLAAACKEYNRTSGVRG